MEALVIIIIVIALIACAILAMTQKNNISQNSALAPIKDQYNLANQFKDFEQKMLTDSGLLEISHNKDLQQQFKDVWKYFNPNEGWFSGWLRKNKTEKQVAVAQNLNQIQKAMLERVIMLAREVIAQRREAAEYFIYLQRNYADLIQIKAAIEYAQKAAEAGMSPEGFDFTNQERVLAEIRDNEEANRQKRELEKEKELAETRAKEHKDKLAAELQAKIDESLHIIEQTEIQNLSEQTRTKRIKDLVQKAILERAEIQARQDVSASDKQELLDIQNNYIKNLKAQLNERYS